jgi:hypothetical protein
MKVRVTRFARSAPLQPINEICVFCKKCTLCSATLLYDPLPAFFVVTNIKDFEILSLALNPRQTR